MLYILFRGTASGSPLAALLLNLWVFGKNINCGYPWSQAKTSEAGKQNYVFRFSLELDI